MKSIGGMLVAGLSAYGELMVTHRLNPDLYGNTENLIPDFDPAVEAKAAKLLEENPFPDFPPTWL